MIPEETEVYRINKKYGAEYLTFRRFDEEPGLRAIFTTRWGGVSGGCCENWNFGFNERDSDENRAYNYRKLAQVMGTELDDLVVSDQTHTVNIETVGAEHAGWGLLGIAEDSEKRRFHDVDGLITDTPGLALVTLHSDCNALYFYDPENRVIGLAHSGWRGTLGKIGARMVEKMHNEFGSDPSMLICGIGPSICGDCFEIDEDVAQMFFDDCEDYRSMAKSGMKDGVKKYYLDLWAVNRHIMAEAGVKPANIECMGLCTKENTDVFFSHRGQHGKRGTMAASMMLEPGFNG
jgi:YfiH family protein